VANSHTLEILISRGYNTYLRTEQISTRTCLHELVPCAKRAGDGQKERSRLVRTWPIKIGFLMLIRQEQKMDQVCKFSSRTDQKIIFAVRECICVMITRWPRKMTSRRRRPQQARAPESSHPCPRWTSRVPISGRRRPDLEQLLPPWPGTSCGPHRDRMRGALEASTTVPSSAAWISRSLHCILINEFHSIHIIAGARISNNAPMHVLFGGYLLRLQVRQLPTSLCVPGCWLLLCQSCFHIRPRSLPHPNSKYFLYHQSHQIFRRMHGTLNVGKKDN
jgi:hypothetical protein